MRRLVVLGALALICGLALVPAWADDAAAPAKEAPGKALFISNGCNSCHTMSAQGIEKKKSASTEAAAAKEAAPAKEAAATKEEGASSSHKAPDLSGVGVERKAEWMVKYLQKLETIKDKKHMKKFKGTDEELTTLAGWLAEQKDAEAAKKMMDGEKGAKTEASAPAEEKKTAEETK